MRACTANGDSVSVGETPSEYTHSISWSWFGQFFMWDWHSVNVSIDFFTAGVTDQCSPYGCIEWLISWHHTCFDISSYRGHWIASGTETISNQPCSTTSGTSVHEMECRWSSFSHPLEEHCNEVLLLCYKFCWAYLEYAKVCWPFMQPAWVLKKVPSRIGAAL